MESKSGFCVAHMFTHPQIPQLIKSPLSEHSAETENLHQ